MTTPAPGAPAHAGRRTTLVAEPATRDRRGAWQAPASTQGTAPPPTWDGADASTTFRVTVLDGGTRTPVLRRRRQEGAVAMDREQRYLTQAEAAALCGRDYTTIRRRRERGQFPGSRRRGDDTGAWEIPLAELIAAGLWRPADGEANDVDTAMGRTKADRRLQDMRVDLERANVRVEALTAALADRRDEVAYLRRALDAALLGSRAVA
jgi:hypothetical protein